LALKTVKTDGRVASTAEQTIRVTNTGRTDRMHMSRVTYRRQWWTWRCWGRDE